MTKPIDQTQMTTLVYELNAKLSDLEAMFLAKGLPIDVIGGSLLGKAIAIAKRQGVTDETVRTSVNMALSTLGSIMKDGTGPS